MKSSETPRRRRTWTLHLFCSSNRTWTLQSFRAEPHIFLWIKLTLLIIKSLICCQLQHKCIIDNIFSVHVLRGQIVDVWCFECGASFHIGNCMNYKREKWFILYDFYVWLHHCVMIWYLYSLIPSFPCSTAEQRQTLTLLFKSYNLNLR